MVTTDFDLDNATIANLAPRIQRREVSPVEIVESSLRRIERTATRSGFLYHYCC